MTTRRALHLYIAIFAIAIASSDQIRSTLRSTATAMPGYAAHEAGAGYVNAFAAVVAVR